MVQLFVGLMAEGVTDYLFLKPVIEKALLDISSKEIDKDVDLCKELVAIVPVYETESWMLANKELIKKHIGTNKTDAQLNIDGHPESMRSPKEKIEEAIRIGRQDLPRKIRDKVTINDLYSILGESLDVRDIENFTSYKDFVNNVKTMFRNLNLLYKPL